MKASIGNHGIVAACFSISTFELLAAVFAQFEFGARLGLLAEILEVVGKRFAIPAKRSGRLLGALRHWALYISSTNIVIIIDLFLTIDIGRRLLVMLAFAAHDAERLLSVLEYGGRAMPAHNDLAPHVFRQFFVEWS